MHAENAFASTQVGRINDDLPVEPARAQQCRIEHVGAIGRGDQDHAIVGLEAVHLDKQLIEGLLAFVVSTAHARTAMATDGVNFVDENDAWRVRLALLEEIAHTRCANADEHFHEVGTGHAEKRTTSLTCDGLGQQRLAGTWRTDEQRALWQTSAKLGEFLRVFQELDDFLELDLGFVGARDVGEGDFWRIPAQQLGLALAE